MLNCQMPKPESSKRSSRELGPAIGGFSQSHDSGYVKMSPLNSKSLFFFKNSCFLPSNTMASNVSEIVSSAKRPTAFESETFDCRRENGAETVVYLVVHSCLRYFQCFYFILIQNFCKSFLYDSIL